MISYLGLAVTSDSALLLPEIPVFWWKQGTKEP